MILLRNFIDGDAVVFQQRKSRDMSLDEIKEMFAKWEEKVYEGKFLKCLLL